MRGGFILPAIPFLDGTVIMSMVDILVKMCQSVNMKMQTVVNDLKRRCDKHGQAEVARQLGVSRSYLCRIVKGNRMPGPLILKALGLRIELTNGR